MTRKAIIWILLAILTGTRLLSQGLPANASYTVLSVLANQVSDFEIDPLGNLYLLLPNQQLKKLNTNHDSVSAFNDVRNFGKLHSMDASNPLRVLLYYKEFGTILILDRFLNVRTTLDLRQAGLLQCSAIAQSFDNNIWLFDELDNQLKKVDERGTVLVTSPDFRILYPDPPKPTVLHDYNRYLFAYDTAKGLVMMDYFGASRGLMPYLGWKNLDGQGKGLLATNGTGWVYLEAGRPMVQEQPLPPEILAQKKIRLRGQRVYALNNQGQLTVYALQ